MAARYSRGLVRAAGIRYCRCGGGVEGQQGSALPDVSLSQKLLMDDWLSDVTPGSSESSPRDTDTAAPRRTRHHREGDARLTSFAQLCHQSPAERWLGLDSLVTTFDAQGHEEDVTRTKQLSAGRGARKMFGNTWWDGSDVY
ncbi:hypothetical protein E2C01_029954 [Portunus trituberculatus]|uniref:Uncharacterized protein n=1 Tax=Portunus trituberculatus TaxID=210409 RepID=A0A5B7EVZ2_PORTR|nr:hypothetical protein [Portunus trituberculatus]